MRSRRPHSSTGTAAFATEGSHPSIERYDADTNLVWRQTGELTDRAMWKVDAGVDSRGRVHAFVESIRPNGSRPELWRLDSTGNIERRSSIDAAITVSKFLVDVHDQSVVLGTSSSGDLVVMRLETNAGAVVEREEFATLSPQLAQTDSAGNIYVTSTAGGRGKDKLRTLLCRVSELGASRCVSLRAEGTSGLFYFDSMAVPEPGVVYCGNDTHLFRFDWPEG